jgi:hypothetical protein
VVVAKGANWPAVYFGDLLSMDWRSQFNADFLIHLVLLAIWICWREGFTPKGYLFGFLSIFLGGMFGFPYLLVATYKAKGDPSPSLPPISEKHLSCNAIGPVLRMTYAAR